jgi:hypothetical protein
VKTRAAIRTRKAWRRSFNKAFMQAAIPLATNVSQLTAEPRDDSGACSEQTRELRDEIVRDVRTAAQP